MRPWCRSSALENALGQVAGLRFIAHDVAPRAASGADAAVADDHHPGAEEIGTSLHAVMSQAAAGGISCLQDDAKVEHGK